jgi:hypothetical protein
MITLTRRASELALAGRYEEAEKGYRMALVLSPNIAKLNNDLGFVLQQQKRYREAIEYYHRALLIEPNNKIARENLALATYLSGEHERALVYFLELVDLIQLEPIEIEDRKLLLRTYQNISLANYSIGELGNALCYSKLAAVESHMTQDLGIVFDRSGQYLRILLSLNEVSDAAAFSEGLYNAFGLGLPSRLMLDYGIAMLATEKLESADNAFTSVISQENITLTIKRTASLFKFYIAKKQNNFQQSEYFFSSLLADTPDLCNDSNLDTFKYWPIILSKEVNQVLNQALNEVCKNGK